MVVDISILGLGITLHHFWPSNLVGRHITVEAPAVGNSLNVRLEGEIRNSDAVSGGVVRLGIEFEGLTEAELAVAGVLGTLIHHDAAAATPTPAPGTGDTQGVPDYAIARPRA